MVGDVKQSIYRFRLAMPQIFIEKEISMIIMMKITILNIRKLFWTKTSVQEKIYASM